MQPMLYCCNITDPDSLTSLLTWFLGVSSVKLSLLRGYRLVLLGSLYNLDHYPSLNVSGYMVSHQPFCS